MLSLPSQRAYWLKKLSNVESRAGFPRETAEQNGSSAGQRHEFGLPEALVEGLNRLARGSAFLLYAALLSATKICLYRYSGTGTVVVGSPRRRGPAEFQAIENSIAIVTEIRSRISFRECLTQVRENLLEAYLNQDYPLDMVVRDLQLQEGTSLFDLVVSLEELHGKAGKTPAAATLMWEREAKAIKGTWTFSKDWATPESVCQYTAQILRILMGVSP